MDQLDPHGLGQYLSPAGIISALGAILGLLPVVLGSVGGAFAIIYYAITIYEKKTVQDWMKNRAARHRAIEVERLEFQQSQIIGRLKQLGVLLHADTTIAAHDNPCDAVITKTHIETSGPTR